MHRNNYGGPKNRSNRSESNWTLKNLLEDGFNATGYESRDTVGGLWKYTDNQEIMFVLETTVSNKRRFKNSYTDFPYPEHSPAFPTAADVQEYLEAYVKHLNFYHIFSCKRRF